MISEYRKAQKMAPRAKAVLIAQGPASLVFIYVFVAYPGLWSGLLFLAEQVTTFYFFWRTVRAEKWLADLKRAERQRRRWLGL